MVATAARPDRAGTAKPTPQPDRGTTPSGAAPRAGAVLALLALIGGVVPIALAWHFGALGIPRNDDWAYARSAFLFADSAKVSGSSWAGMNLVGQLVLSYPVVAVFGHRIAALQIEVATIGVIGLYATYDLAKQLLSPRRALFVAVLVALLPMWASLSASFMTDVPGFAVAMVCLALGARAVEGETIGAGFFYASLAVGFLAFTIREDAIVAPLAVGAVAVLMAARRPGSLRRSKTVAAIVLLLSAAALFFAWRRSLPGFIHEKPRVPTLRLVRQSMLVTLQSALLVGLLITPAIALADPRRLFRRARARAPRVTVAAVAATCVVAGVAIRGHWSGSGGLGPGDYVRPNGSLGTYALKGVRPDLMPGPLLTALAIVGALALVVLVGMVAATVTESVVTARRRRLAVTTSPALLIVTLAALGYAVACIVAVALGYSRLFDRYLIPIVPLVAILVLRGDAGAETSRRARIAGCATLAALAVFGSVYAANSAAFDGTKWRVASQAVRLAKDAKRVDGGHTWNDNAAGRHLRGRFKGGCIVLRAGPRPAPADADVVGIGSVWGPTGSQVWIVARQVSAC